VVCSGTWRSSLSCGRLEWGKSRIDNCNPPCYTRPNNQTVSPNWQTRDDTTDKTQTQILFCAVRCLSTKRAPPDQDPRDYTPKTQGAQLAEWSGIGFVHEPHATMGELLGSLPISRESLCPYSTGPVDCAAYLPIHTRHHQEHSPGLTSDPTVGVLAPRSTIWWVTVSQSLLVARALICA